MRDGGRTRAQGRQKKGFVGSALVAVGGGGRWRGLIVVVVVVFVVCPRRALLVVRRGTLSSSFAFVVVRAPCRPRALSCASVIVGGSLWYAVCCSIEW